MPSTPVFAVDANETDLSFAAQAVVEAAMGLSPRERFDVLQLIELSLSEPLRADVTEAQRNTLTEELQRRLDDYDSGRDPGFSEEEIQSKVEALLGRRP